MQFTNPYILYGLFAISIPIIIHLFNLRRFKKVEFTNVAFIRDIKSQTRKSSRLKHLLVLILRILTISAVVFAFARPFIPVSENESSQHQKVSIYIDNSFSMQGESPAGPLIDLARKKASEIIEAYGLSADFQIISNQHSLASTAFTGKDDALLRVQEVEAAASGTNIHDIIRRFLQGKKDEKSKNSLFIISDFQRNAFLAEEIAADSTPDIMLVHLAHANESNLSIDSCYAASPYIRPGEIARIKVQLSNHSPDYLEKIPLKLMLEGEQRAFASVTMGPYSKETLELAFTPERNGNLSGFVEITDYPITFDNRYYLSVDVQSEINILGIGPEEGLRTLKKLYSVDSSFVFQQSALNQLRYEYISMQDLVIVQGIESLPSGLSLELKKLLESGGSVVVFPAVEAEATSYNQLLNPYGLRLLPADTSNEKTRFIQTESPFFESVFDRIPENPSLPVVQLHYPLQTLGDAPIENLILLRNGRPLLARTNNGNGELLVFTAPLGDEGSNLHKQALWVPVMFRAAFLSRGVSPLAYTPGNKRLIRIKGEAAIAEEAPQVFYPQSDESFIPYFNRNGKKLNMVINETIADRAGIYSLLNGNERMPLALNYGRSESDTRYLTGKQTDSIAKLSGYNYRIYQGAQQKLDKEIINSLSGKQLWRWFIIFALIFSGIEILVLRYWK